ncbi:hypothetical protein KPH14_002668 [Odynerus spinipes]|uniref:Uncharacterized protein n=1 Tax=Odynerus spinipes TaxID=1348599 RepID=A0AAD9VLP0_9HYME|nr:hypothetical protein KPH14_002668 [Odynerus spinipes]
MTSIYDTKLANLEQLKIKLLREISVLQCEIQEQMNTENLVLKKRSRAFPSKRSLQQKNKLCDLSYHATGIVFDNVNKDWLHNKSYKYTANVVTKAIRFYLELTVDLKYYPDFEVIDITCHFLDVKDCFMLEITPWVQLLAKRKNFSFLMTAISDYSEYNVFRIRILDSLVADNYISYEGCKEENGGVIIDVKSAKNDKQIYVKFRWSMKFFEETCHIEHYFTIDATEFGMEFVEKNTLLLKKFCTLDLKKKDLIELWTELCTTIDTYEDNKQ